MATLGKNVGEGKKTKRCERYSLNGVVVKVEKGGAWEKSVVELRRGRKWKKWSVVVGCTCTDKVDVV